MKEIKGAALLAPGESMPEGFTGDVNDFTEVMEFLSRQPERDFRLRNNSDNSSGPEFISPK